MGRHRYIPTEPGPSKITITVHACGWVGFWEAWDTSASASALARRQGKLATWYIFTRTCMSAFSSALSPSGWVKKKGSN